MIRIATIIGITAMLLVTLLQLLLIFKVLTFEQQLIMDRSGNHPGRWVLVGDDWAGGEGYWQAAQQSCC